MKNILDFLIEVGKLKKLKRRGIMFYGVKDPETVADHTFRMAIMTWLLGEKKGFDVRKMLKIVLVHDLCEVYAGDITPYDGVLPEDEEEKAKFVRKWVRLSQAKKLEKYRKKLKLEKESIEKLVRNLPEDLKKEILSLWYEYERRFSPEGIFIHQIDRVENLLEAFECFKRDKDFPTRPWWEHVEEVVDDPILLEFIREIEEAEMAIREKL